MKVASFKLTRCLGCGVFMLLLVSCAGEPTAEREPADGPSLSSIRAEDVKDAKISGPPLMQARHDPVL